MHRLCHYCRKSFIVYPRGTKPRDYGCACPAMPDDRFRDHYATCMENNRRDSEKES